MLESLARRVARRPWVVLTVAPLVLLIGAVCALGVFDRLATGGWHAADDEATRAARLVETAFEQGPANLVLLVAADGGVDSPAAVAAGGELTARLAAEPGVTAVVSYWSPGRPDPLRAEDGGSALVLARLAGDAEAVGERAAELGDDYSTGGTPGDDGLAVRVGGQPAAMQELVEQSERDLRRSELAASPAVLLCLLVVFGGAVAAALPIGAGLLAVLGTLGVLTALSTVTDVSVFALNITTALGFGLAVDYGLFVVTRFREELDAGRAVPDAVVATVATAGRTVLVSALTVAVSLASLLVFPMYYLRSFAYGGIAVVGLAAAAAVVVLPAVLLLLGRRVDAWSLRRPPRGRHARPRRSAGGVRAGHGAWHRVARFVMRRPAPVALAVTGVLVVLGLPFAGASFDLPDDRRLPVGSEPHVVAEALRHEFPAVPVQPVFAVVPESGVPVLERAPELGAYAAALSDVPGVDRVETVTGVYVDGARVGDAPGAGRFVGEDGEAVWLSVGTAAGGPTEEGRRLVEDLREVRSPFEVLVGGDAAQLVDTEHSLVERLPLAAAIVGLSTLVLLFLFTGSVLLPLKAVVLNLLSLTAAFGVMVWGFQDGHLRGVVGDFQVTGTLDLMTPILMFCIAFGLSMDYEVFLLSRIKEEFELTGDNEQSVALGLQRTGGIITSAAAIVIVVLAALATSGLAVLKLLGVGLALAVLVDATLVRALLVPAFMRLAGSANWWAPPLLRRVHERWGFSEGAPPAGPGAPGAEERVRPEPAEPAVAVAPAGG
ncbi:MMPL family transporter [Geodermatophilus sp. SYSU D00742]